MGNTAAAPATSRKTARDRLVRAFQETREELISTLYFLLGHYEDAQDVVQETFLKCWRAPKSLEKVRNLRAWLFRVGLNAAKDLQRNAWRRRARPLEAAPPAATLPGARPQPSPADVVVHHE
jgi:RNA polymerase sigma-70 factor (ECF subfamily)